MMQRRLCIWLPTWPVQRRLADSPALDGRPFAVVAEQARGAKVIACSSAARKLGVTPGMAWTEAESFAGTQVRSDPDDPAANRDALEAFADACTELSPIVGVEDGERPECVFIDATGCARAFGGEEQFLDRAVEVARRRRYSPRVALADTIGLAWAAAHFDPQPRVLIPPGRCAEALASMPLAALRIAEDAVTALDRLGIYTVGRLAELPRKLLPERFGKSLLDRLDQALGNKPELWAIRQFLPPIRLAQEFETPLEHQDVVEACTARLAEALVAELPSETGIRRIELRLEREGRPALLEEIEFSRPMRLPKHLWEVVKLRMQRLEDIGGVVAIRIEAVAVAETAVVQDSLFDDPSVRMRKQEMTALLDRLIGRLGRQGVLRCSASAHPDPQRQSLFLPAVEKSPMTKPSARALWLGRRRPLRIFRTPIPVEVRESFNGPRRLVWQGKDHAVKREWGPERIETGWHHDHPMARDYYRLETESGGHWWAFREAGCWYVHGSFE